MSLFLPQQLFTIYRICPWYNTSRNNLAEALTALYKNEHIRYKAPPVSIWKFFQVYNNLISNILEVVNTTNWCPLAVHGMRYHTNLKKAFEEAEANKGKLILNITDSLVHFPPLCLDYNNILNFKEKESWLNNCIRHCIPVFLGAEQPDHSSLTKNLGT